MVNNCDIRLLQRVCALADNMNQQLSEHSEIFDNQVQCFIAYNGLYAARQVLLLNRELRLCKRVQAVKDFFSSPAMSRSFQEAKKKYLFAQTQVEVMFGYQKSAVLVVAVTSMQLCASESKT
jgi:hypothetical protein